MTCPTGLAPCICVPGPITEIGLGLYPNIDFYSGITLKAMGFPTTMFTVLFAFLLDEIFVVQRDVLELLRHFEEIVIGAGFG